jgi:hypothetical protein
MKFYCDCNIFGLDMLKLVNFSFREGLPVVDPNCFSKKAFYHQEFDKDYERVLDTTLQNLELGTNTTFLKNLDLNFKIWHQALLKNPKKEIHINRYE